MPTGGVVCPCASLPQHTTVPSARSPQAWLAPMLMRAPALGISTIIGVDVAIGVIVGVAVGTPVGTDVGVDVGVGVATDAGGLACPDPFQPQQDALPSDRSPQV